MKKEQFLEYILRLLERAGEQELRLIYHFVLHLVK